MINCTAQSTDHRLGVQGGGGQGQESKESKVQGMRGDSISILDNYDIDII